MSNEENSGLRHLFSQIKALFQKPSGAETPARAPQPTPSSNSANSDELLRFAQEAPFVYGYWSDLKRLYKQAEAVQNIEILTALISRLDTVPFPRQPKPAPTALDQLKLYYIYNMVATENVLFFSAMDMQRNHVLYGIDFANPATPNPIVKIPFRASQRLTIEGTTLYVVEEKIYRSPGGVHIFDIADVLRPQGSRQPRKVGELNLPYSTGIAVQSALAVVAVNAYPNASLQCVDISRPAAPRVLSKLQIEIPVGIALSDRHTCVITQNRHRSQGSGLHIVDVTDPAHPYITQFLEIPNPVAIAVQGRYAYVASATQNWMTPDTQAGLYCIELGSTARQVGFFPMPNALSVAVRGDHAYVALNKEALSRPKSGGLRILDISDPAQPRQVGSYTPSEAYSVCLTGTAAFLNATRSNAQRIVETVDISEPTRPVQIGMPPKRKTLAYMKRRARRAIRLLALRDPDAYIRLACGILTQSGKGREAVDRATQWISMDLLYGSSTRVMQHGHGRGNYAIMRQRLVIKTREENHPELWDRHPELAGLLYANPDLPWQTQEMALKMLRSWNVSLPDLTDASLARFLNSPSALLCSVAAKQASAALDHGTPLPADLAATLYLRGTRWHRRSVTAFLEMPEESRNWGVGDVHRATVSWNNAFAMRLITLASIPTQSGTLTPKQQAAFLLVLDRFPAIAQRETTPAVTARLYGTGRAELLAWALNRFQNLPASQIEATLIALESLEESLRSRALEAIRLTVTQKQFDASTVQALVTSSSAWIRRSIWTLLAHSATDLKLLNRLWENLLDAPEETDALRSALNSPDALTIFQRVNMEVGRLVDRLRTRPWLAPLLPLDVLERILRTLPVADTLELLRQPSDLQWQRLKPALLAMLEQTARRDAFWEAAFARISETADETLTMRLLQDPALIGSFLEVEEIDAFLKSANPAFGGILSEWVRAHPERFTRDTPELLSIATHMLPELREFGQERARALGFDLPFALRLVESELPSAVALGREYFEAESLAPAERQDLLIALCDSPRPTVRAYGRAQIEQHAELFHTPSLLTHLAENPDPEMQAFVAGKLLQERPVELPTGAFDRAVLRQRDRGRRAKELVKTRLEQAPSEDIALLLEMAHSRTPRDAEWALSQLARLALQGIDIPGFILEGIAGG